MDTKIIAKYLNDINSALSKAKVGVKLSNVFSSDAYFARMISNAINMYEFTMASWFCDLAFKTSSNRVASMMDYLEQGDSEEILMPIFVVLDYDRNDTQKIFASFDDPNSRETVRKAIAQSMENCKTKIHTLFMNDYVRSIFEKAIGDKKKANELDEYYGDVQYDFAPVPYFMVLLYYVIDGKSFKDAQSNPFNFDIPHQLEEVFDNIKDILKISDVDEVLKLI